MAASLIQNVVNNIVEPYGRNTTRDQAHAMLREARDAVSAFYRKELKAGESLGQAARNDPEAVHRITTDNFGFKIFEQPDYAAVDDFAWEFSQRYTTLEGVTLPKNAEFYTSDKKKVSREEVEKKMATGDFHLFDIALSNQYVLLGANERFSVNDLENKFHTNNEHMPPQSSSQQDGQVRVYRADPRVIIISYTETNSERGHLQVVFLDERNKPVESIAMVHKPGEEEPELTRQVFRANGASRRYPISAEDAPYYAYALALAHFANGFSDEAKRNWFDQPQAEQVLKMLNKLGAKDVDQNIEPVIRDALADAKVLKGNINPTVLLPNMFAAALQAEIEQGKFRGGDAREEIAEESFAEKEQKRRSKPAANRQTAF